MTFLAIETPEHIAKLMAEKANIQILDHVLEPSAGNGPLALAARKAGAIVHCIELNLDRCIELHRLNFDVKRSDFLKLQPYAIGYYDKILMCPPKNSTEHLDHAIEFLKGKDSVLIALVQKSFISEKYLKFYEPLNDEFIMNDKKVDCGLVVISKKD